MIKETTKIDLFFIFATLSSLAIIYAISYQYSKRDLKEIECAEKGGVMIEFHCIKKSAVIEVEG